MVLAKYNREYNDIYRIVDELFLLWHETTSEGASEILPVILACFGATEGLARLSGKERRKIYEAR